MKGRGSTCKFRKNFESAARITKFTRERCLSYYEKLTSRSKSLNNAKYSLTYLDNAKRGFSRKLAKLTLTFDPVTQNQKGSSPHHVQLTCEV